MVLLIALGLHLELEYSYPADYHSPENILIYAREQYQ